MKKILIVLGLWWVVGLVVASYTIPVLQGHPPWWQETPNPYQTEYERMLYPTVRVKTTSGTGSGVIFHHKDTEDTKKIYVLTAAHVVGDNKMVSLEIYPNDIKIDAEVVITDTTKDLALLCALCPYGRLRSALSRMKKTQIGPQRDPEADTI
jgi:S1-C subfamily serine protease